MKTHFMQLTLGLSAMFGAVAMPAFAAGQESYPEICYVYAASLDENGNEVRNIGVQGQGAYDYFDANFCGANGRGGFLPSYKLRKLDPEQTKCVWVHIDRKDLEQGWTKLPDEFSSPMFIDALFVYMREGGNVYLSGQAVELLSPMWRIASSEKSNQWDHPDQGVWENSTWGIHTPYRDDAGNLHPIFRGLTPLNPDSADKFGILNGDFFYENHNAIWNLSNISYLYGSEGEEGYGLPLSNRERFEADNQATVLASFDWDTNLNFAGLIEYHPVYSWDVATQDNTRASGTIIANGIAAMQWRYFRDAARNDERSSSANTCRANLERLTGNILDYLAGDERIVKEGHPYNLPSQTALDESLESTGLIAMYIGYDDLDQLEASGNKQECAAYYFFRETYLEGKNFLNNAEYQQRYHGRGPAVLWKGDKDKIRFCGQECEDDVADTEGFECVWVNIAGNRADQIITDEKDRAHADGYRYGPKDLHQIFDTEEDYNYLISQLQKFRAAGGNLYTTKFANLMLNDIDPTIMTPTQVTKDTKIEADRWGLNVNFQNYNNSDHPIFSTIDLANREHGQGVTLFEGEGERLDTNCVWWLSNEKTGQDGWDQLSATDRLYRFNYENNATVLGVWGHNADYAFYTAAMVEFHPARNEVNGPQYITPITNVYARRGSIVANGAGAYEWDTDENGQLDDQPVRTLTANTLSYLTPVMREEIYTGIDTLSSEAAVTTSAPVYYNLQGIRIAAPRHGVFIEVRGKEIRKVVIE